MRKIPLLLWVLFFSGAATAQDLLKVAFYNLFEYPKHTPTNRAPILKNILSDINPDLFLVCELLTEDAADDILYNVLDYNTTRNFAKAAFIPNPAKTSNLHQLLFYDANIWQLLTTEALLTPPYRNSNKYKLQLRAQDPLPPIFLYVFVVHLKSSPGLANRRIRLKMIESILIHLESLEPEAFVLIAGDFNVYSSQEEAYQAVLNTQNPIVFLDPLNTPGTWHKNQNFASLHTQSTRVHFSEFGGGAGAGMDDRFDFILLSENFFKNHADLQYKPNSYTTYGNNGNCFEKSINDADCNGKYAQKTRNWLYKMSDHLPVLLEINTKRKLADVPIFKSKTNFPSLLQNPVEDYLELQLPEATDFALDQSTFKIRIFDSLGRMLLEKQIQSKTTHLKIHVEHLHSGMYFIQFSNYISQSIKFIKK